MKISKRTISPSDPPFIVAEIGANHAGSATEGYRLIDAARDCGADAVKIQCYTADRIAIKGETKVGPGIWQEINLHDLYKSAETPPKLVKDLFLYAQRRRIVLFSSVFDFEGVDFIVRLGMPAIKIASFELVDTPLIQYAAETHLPVIISTGMGTREEINAAINAYHAGNNYPSEADNLALLHCVSSYPARPEECNLPALGPLSELGGGHHVVGFSDHTLGVGTSNAAIAFGASIVEKHFILDRSSGGPDASFSMEPHEFSLLVKSCKEAWQAIQVSVPPTPNLAYRKSIFLVRDVSVGDSFSRENCRILRPASGLAPLFYASVLSGVATRDLRAGTPLLAHHVSTLC